MRLPHQNPPPGPPSFLSLPLSVAGKVLVVLRLQEVLRLGGLPEGAALRRRPPQSVAAAALVRPGAPGLRLAVTSASRTVPFPRLPTQGLVPFSPAGNPLLFYFYL